ncbi:5272_t:CDS:2, partial [Ambispora leptoticha]
DEAKEKLTKIKPVSLGQARRIGGINPTDIQMLKADPQKRPGAEELEGIIGGWIYYSGRVKEDTPFYQQYQSLAEEYNQFSQNTPYQIHPTAITHKLVKEFIQARKKMKRDNSDKNARREAGKLEEQLEEKGLSDENIEKIIKYCERFIKQINIMVIINQNEFNNKYSKEVKEIRIKNKDFQGHLIIEDYLNLEKLYLRDIDNIEKITLKNLPQLKLCTIRDCGTKDLVIENCLQINNLNIENNLLTNLEFIKDLENLEELELDGNDKLNTNTLELLENIQALKKENEFLSIKYDELKKFLKGILVSLSSEEKKGLSVELNKKINRKDKIRKELESELAESKEKIEELEKELKEKVALQQETKKELKVQKTTTEALLKQLVAKTIEKEKASNENEANDLQKEINDLRQKLKVSEKEVAKLEGKLEAKQEEIERISKTIEKAIDTPNQSINTYNIQYNTQYQQLETETEKQITESLTDKEVTPEEQKVINKTILFLGTKELFINHRQATVNSLIDCYNKLEKRLGNKLNKFTTAVSMTNIASKLANIIPGGGVVEAPIGILGDTINLTGNIIKEKDL